MTNTDPNRGSPVYDMMNELTKEATERYQKNMNGFLDESEFPPSSLELRQKHAEFKVESIDHFRKRSIGRPVGVWKLERELDLIFEQMASEVQRVRKTSFGSDQSDQGINGTDNSNVDGNCWIPAIAGSV